MTEPSDPSDPSVETPENQPPGDITRAGGANVAAVESCYQLVLWLIPVLDGLPRRQKF